MTTQEKSRALFAPVLSQAESEIAKVAERLLMESLDHSRAAVIKVECDNGEMPAVEVPPQALRLIAQLLGAMSERKPIMLMPAKQELSTVEAANFMNVSRPFIIKEIDEGRIPYRMVGTHRRIQFDDLKKYAEEMRAQQKNALDRMAENARELGLDY